MGQGHRNGELDEDQVRWRAARPRAHDGQVGLPSTTFKSSRFRALDSSLLMPAPIAGGLGH
jgi:hypothetical protein